MEISEQNTKQNKTLIGYYKHDYMTVSDNIKYRYIMHIMFYFVCYYIVDIYLLHFDNSNISKLLSDMMT